MTASTGLVTDVGDITGMDTATFSVCRSYRYALTRVWGAEPGRLAVWVMLNPSTADGRMSSTARICTTMAPTRKLTPEDERRIVDLYESGQCFAEIQAAIGCSDYLVRHALRRHEIELRPPSYDRAVLRGEKLAAALKLYTSGASARAVCREFGIGIDAARGALRRAGVLRGERRPHKWTEEERLAVVALYDGGKAMPIYEIATRYSTGKESVSQILLQAGVVIKRGSKPRVGKPRVFSGKYIAVLLRPGDPLIGMAQRSGYVMEHRLVMARALGRELLPTETVHHIDNDPRNNELSNLQLRQGRHGVGYTVRCADCGSHRVEPVPLGDNT